MTYKEILAEHKKSAESVNRAAQTYDFHALFNSGPGIDKYREFIAPETYGRMRGLLDTVAAPAGAGVKEHLKNSFERQILVKMLNPGASGNAPRNMADALANTVAGSLEHPQKATDVFRNSIEAGLLEKDAATLSYNIMRGGGVPSAEQAQAQKRIAERRAKLGSTATNSTLTGMVGQTLQSLAMTKDGMIYAGAGSFTAGLLGAAAAGAAAGTIVPGAGTAAGFLIGSSAYLAGQLGQAYLNRKLYQGQEYEKMTAAGIDHETAKKYSAMAAGINVTIAAALGAVPVEGTLAKVLGRELGKKVLGGNVIVSSVKQAGARLGKEALMNLPDLAMEGAEEAAQSVASSIMLELAAMERDRRFADIDWDTVNAHKENIADAFRGGLAMAAVLGVPKAFAGTAAAGMTVAKAAQIKREMDIVLKMEPDREARRQILEDAFGGVVSEDVIEEYSGRDLPEAQGFRKDAPAPVEGSPAPFRLGNGGSLRGRPGVDRFVFYDPAGFRYGEAKYAVTDGKVAVNAIDVTNKNIADPDALKGRVLRDIAKRFPEYEITWDTKDEADTRVRDTALKQIRMDRDGTAHNELHDAVAELLGLGDLPVTDKLPDTLTDAERAAFDRNEGRVKGAYLPANAARLERLIYLSKKADFTTLHHEMLHEKIDSLDEAERKEWADALGLADGSAESWNAEVFDGREGKKINAHEYLAEKWEDYLASPDNPAIPGKLKALFDRIAAAMSRVYEALGRVVRDVEPEIKAKFDKMIAEGLAAREGAEARADNTAAEGDGGALFSTEGDGDNAEAARQYEEVESRYTNPDGTKTEGWMKAPNGKPTKLDERQWVQVRTPDFKKWFGDWETEARIEEIKAIEPKTYNPTEGVDKKKVEDIFRNFTPIQKDGLDISFPVGTVGKLYGLGGTKYMYLAPAIREMLDGSIYAYSSNYISEKTRPDGSAHKTHTNIEQYHNYVNKIKTDKEYYIRFTVQELKHPKQRKGELHSGFLTEVSLYDKDGSPLTSGNSPGGTALNHLDKRLADFFASVNPSEVSAARDAETGEPLAVCHYAEGAIENSTRRKRKPHFFEIKEDAEIIHARYGKSENADGIDTVFFNLRNPAEIDFSGKYFLGNENLVEKAIDSAKKSGNDGVIVKDIRDWSEVPVPVKNPREPFDDYIVFSRNQILSANPGEKSSPDFSSDKHISDLQGELNDGRELHDGLREDGVPVAQSGIGPRQSKDGRTSREIGAAVGLPGTGTDGLGGRYPSPDNRNVGIGLKREPRAATVAGEQGAALETPGPAPSTDDGSPLFSLEEKADNEGMANIVETQKFKTFIDDAMSNRQAPYKRIAIGAVSENAQKYIENNFGIKVSGIGIDNSGVIHAKKKAAHNLEPDDLLLAVDVINNSDSIELSEKQHSLCKVLEFKKDVDGEITFIAEIHEKEGYLLVFDAWRKKKARRNTTADTGNTGTPSANVLNASPLALTSSLSPDSENKSSPENDPGVYFQLTREGELEEARKAAAEAEIAAMKARVAEWTSQDTLAKAKGKSRDDIFREYDNTLQPIAYVPERYISHFSGSATDNRIYCGQAYFLDHAVNHHPEVVTEEYSRIQDILNKPDEVIIDQRPDKKTGKSRDNLLFLKQYANNILLAVGLEANTEGKILLHKSLHNTKKNPYPSLPRIQDYASVDGVPTIGRIAGTIPGGSLSARDDSANINHFVRPVNPAENTSPENDPGVYFQLTREGELEEARKAAAGGMGRDDFINGQLEYSLAMDEPLPEDIEGDAEAREWLGEIYDEAAGAKEARLTTAETDERLEEAFRSDKAKFDRFLLEAGLLLKHGPNTDAEKALYAEIEAVGRRGEKSGGYPLFENLARSIANGHEIKAGTRRSLITYMSNDMTRFRDLYTRLTGDPEYRRLAETEIYEDFETGIQDRERLTPYELGRAKAKIRDAALREKIADGTATDADYERVIAEADKSAAERKAEIAAFEKTVSEQEEKLSEAGHEYARQSRLLRESKEETADAKEAVRKLEEALSGAEKKAARAVLAKHAALGKLKKRLRAREAEKKAAAKLLADRRRILERAMRPPSGNVDAKHAQKIRAFQAAFEYGAGKVPATVTVAVDGEKMSLGEFRERAAKGELGLDGLSKRLRKYLETKGINEAGTGELQDFLNQVNDMKAEGRAVLSERLAKRRALARMRIKRSLDAIEQALEDWEAGDPKTKGAVKRLGEYLASNDPEEKKKLLRKADALRPVQEWLYIDRLLELSDLPELKELVAGGRDRANYEEGQHVNRRYAGLDALLGKTEKEKNALIAELGTENILIKGVWHNNRDYRFSKAFLMTASIGLDDPKMRKHLLYGALMSNTERADMRDESDAAKGNEEAKEAYQNRIKAIGDRKEALLRAAIAQNLTGEDLAIRDYIRDDFTENFERINEAAYSVDNTLMSKVESYLPVFGIGRGAGEAEISVNGAGVSYSPAKGFTIDRKTIPEYALGPVETDIFKLFYRGVEGQEHFAAFAPFIKELNGVLNGVLGGRDPRGKELKEKLRAMHGKGLTDTLDDYIAVMANPKAADTGSSFGLNIVGKSTLGYITWNFLSGLKQIPQSFTPFLLKVQPEHLAASALKYMKSAGMLNNRDYNALVRETFEKSSDLKRRVMNMEQEYANRLKAAAQTKLGKAYAFAVNGLGMRLQRDADMFACVSGWDAAYNEKKTELMKEGGLSMPETERAAVIHADRILADTQPTSNPLYQSKGFREAPKAFKFFSTPLEKMFQTAAGIPEQVKRGQLAYAARYAAGIAITGLAIALFQRKFDDEDEPEELLKKLAYYGVAEPALAHLPLAMLSSSAAWAAERMITGEKRPSPQRDFLPLLSTGERVVSDLDNGKIDRLALDALEFSGYLLGMPTAQIKRMLKAGKEGDPWGVVAGSK